MTRNLMLVSLGLGLLLVDLLVLGPLARREGDEAKRRVARTGVPLKVGDGDKFFAYVEYCTSRWRAGADSPQSFPMTKNPESGRPEPIGFAAAASRPGDPDFHRRADAARRGHRLHAGGLSYRR